MEIRLIVVAFQSGAADDAFADLSSRYQDNASALITLHDSALALNYCDSLLILSDGRLIGTIIPSETSISDMEQLLSKIYGTISLSKLNDRLGNSRLVMMKEAETS